MSPRLNLLQVFRRNLIDRTDYIKKNTYCSDLEFTPVISRAFTVKVIWKCGASFNKVYDYPTILGASYSLCSMDWRIQGDPCRHARELVQQALEYKLRADKSAE